MCVCVCVCTRVNQYIRGILFFVSFFRFFPLKCNLCVAWNWFIAKFSFEAIQKGGKSECSILYLKLQVTDFKNPWFDIFLFYTWSSVVAASAFLAHPARLLLIYIYIYTLLLLLYIYTYIRGGGEYFASIGKGWPRTLNLYVILQSQVSSCKT